MRFLVCIFFVLASSLSTLEAGSADEDAVASFEKQYEALHKAHKGAYPGRGRSHELLRRERAEFAKGLAALIDVAPDSASWHTVIGEAAMFSFLAAMPSKQDAPDDPIRITPGESWDDYIRLARLFIDRHKDGLNREDIAWLAYPAYLFYEKGYACPHVYSSRYWELPLEVFKNSDNPCVRAVAGFYIVKLSVLSDWEFACKIAGEVYDIEKGAEVSTVHEVETFVDALNEIFQVFESSLNRTKRDITLALELFAEGHGHYPTDRELRNERKTWKILRPYLDEAIRKGRDDWRVPEWMGLYKNRIGTVPGLRIAGVRWKDRGKRDKVPRIYFKHVHVGGHVRNQGDAPWSKRRSERLRLIRGEDGGL